MTAPPALGRLRLLLGAWQGEGQGDYPTIDAFRYSEHLAVRWNGIEPLLVFEQRTWKGSGDDRSEPLHWETGFFNATEDGPVELVNAQNGERVEVLRGNLEPNEGGFTLELDSVLIGHDDRLVCTRRRYTLEGDTLNYVTDMETTRNPKLERHLTATLRRCG